MIATKYRATVISFPHPHCKFTSAPCSDFSTCIVNFTAARDPAGMQRRKGEATAAAARLGKNCWNVTFLPFFLVYLQFVSSPGTWFNSLPLTTAPSPLFLTFWPIHLREFGSPSSFIWRRGHTQRHYHFSQHGPKQLRNPASLLSWSWICP